MDKTPINDQTFDSVGKPKSSRKKILLIIVGLALFSCCGIFAVVSLISPSSSEVTTTSDTVAVETQVNRTQQDSTESEQAIEEVDATSMPVATAEVETPEPTNTSESTDTPQPTSTTIPTATNDPNIVRPGTHIVGTDIQPGIYRGNAGSDLLQSCYWARLGDLTGGLDAILANSNSIGQFYIEILDSDVALETACELTFLSTLPESTGEFPTNILPGVYIVGVDIGAGTYRGEGGAEILDSCYWARLSDLTGGLDSILANDNSIGQFFIQVLESDFALSTACELELVQ